MDAIGRLPTLSPSLGTEASSCQLSSDSAGL